MEIETSISSNQSMANVLEDDSQIDVQIPSTQPPDPRDIPSTSRKRKGPQIPSNKRRKLSPLQISEFKDMLKHTEQNIERCKRWKMVVKDNRISSSTNDSD